MIKIKALFDRFIALIDPSMAGRTNRLAKKAFTPDFVENMQGKTFNGDGTRVVAKFDIDKRCQGVVTVEDK